MSLASTMINFDGQTLFKVMQGETYTVPQYIAVQSPTNQSSGVFPTTTFNSQRPTAGGILYAAFSDAAGPTSLDFTKNIGVNDVIAVAAIATGAAVVTVNGVTVFSIPATAVAGVLGFFG